MKHNAKSLWSAFRKIPLWVWLLISWSSIGWSYFADQQRHQARQQQQVKLDSIAVAQDKLGRDIDRYKLKYSALFARKTPLTPQDKAKLKVAEEELKAIQARATQIKRRIRLARDSEKTRSTRE